MTRNDGPRLTHRLGTLPRRAGGLLDRLFPPACVVCGATVAPGGPPLCGPCRTRLPHMAPPRCPRCGATAAGRGEGPGCGECDDWEERTPPCRTPCRMEGVAARLVRSLKYAGWTELAPFMAAMMAPSARALTPHGAALVPVPLTASRLRERGYNQADLLARALSRVTGWPVLELLRRSGNPRTQALLRRGERRMNVSGAFEPMSSGSWNASGRAGSGAGRERVLLVDDVITTGATVQACSAALMEGGCRPVGAVAFARTLPPLHGA